MGFSKLTDVIILADSSAILSREGKAIDSVAIHTMAGNMTAEGCGDWFAPPGVIAKTKAGKPASSNYGIDSNGKIGGYVDEDNRSCCTSSRGVDSRAISIEVASLTSGEPYECTDAAYESLIKLLVDICQRHNIPALRWKNDKAYAEAAANGGPVTEQNMFVHKWFNTGKSCPGEYLFSRQGAIATEVNRRLGNGEVYTDGGTISSDGSTTSGSAPVAQTITIDYQIFNPYVITLDRNSEVDYDMLKSAKVVGAIVEAGCRYETNGMVTKRFENPKLKEQIEKLKEAGIDYGLYMTCRARNSVEAKDEMDHFLYPLRKYGAKLGAWLDLEISENDIYNTPILNRYKKDLIRLGFKGHMGIRCDRDFLKHIKWDTTTSSDDDTNKQGIGGSLDTVVKDVTEAASKKADESNSESEPCFKNDFFLWLVDPVEDVAELETLLDPEFFDTDGKG